MQHSSELISKARTFGVGTWLCLLVLTTGCSDTSSTPADGYSEAVLIDSANAESVLELMSSGNRLPTSQLPTAPVTLSINRGQPRSGDDDEAQVNPDSAALNFEDADDVVQQILAVIRSLRIHALPADPAAAIAARRQRNLKIVELSADVLRRTLDDQTRQDAFSEGIQQLLEARFQLALNGNKADIDQLYADVQALNDRDPKSSYAAEGIYTLARFAHTHARLLGRDDPAWFENFSRWAREFADRFEDQHERAVALLSGAGRSCELHAAITTNQADADRLLTEAKLCYVALSDRFPQTTQGQEAVAVLRRLALPGHRLSQFAGPTLDGSYVTAENFVDQVTVIYFWDSQNQDFVDKLLPLLLQAHQVSNSKLRFVGVTLDTDEQQVHDFVKRHRLPGQQVFFPEPSQRSWDSPIIRFWGISKSPTVWLIDREGKVSAVDVGPATLVSAMRNLFK